MSSDIIQQPRTQLEHAFQTIERLEHEKAVLLEALKEIAKGKGEFSYDPLEYAENTIDYMKSFAKAALRNQPMSDIPPVVHNPTYPCSCTINHARSLDTDRCTVSIEYCPVHAAAPNMLKAAGKLSDMTIKSITNSIDLIECEVNTVKGLLIHNAVKGL